MRCAKSKMVVLLGIVGLILDYGMGACYGGAIALRNPGFEDEKQGKEQANGVGKYWEMENTIEGTFPSLDKEYKRSGNLSQKVTVKNTSATAVAVWIRQEWTLKDLELTPKDVINLAAYCYIPKIGERSYVAVRIQPFDENWNWLKEGQDQLSCKVTDGFVKLEVKKFTIPEDTVYIRFCLMTVPFQEESITVYWDDVSLTKSEKTDIP